MAKKKSGGSNMGLIITLVFFVLTTVVLGVTTYMGYSEIETKETAKKEADKGKLVLDNEVKYVRMQNRVLRAWTGHPVAGVEAATVAGELQAFNAGGSKDQKDREDVAKAFKALNDAMPWDAGKETAPSLTYEQRLTKLNADVNEWKAKSKKAEEATKKVETEKAEVEKAKDAEIVALKKSYDDFSKKLDGELKGGLAAIGAKQSLAEEEGKKRAELMKQKDDIGRNVAKLTKDLADAKAALVAATTAKKDALTERDELQTKLSALYELTGRDSKAVEAATLDAQARKVLETWNKSWRVVGIDSTGDKAYISLGSNDGLVPQVTFSVHGIGPNGKLNPNPKGTVEVVRIMGSNQAQARITSVKDARKEPILKGDRLFNPTWDPSRQRRIAIAGLADLGGDGVESNEELRRLLTRQKVQLDAYIDTKDLKEPKIVGQGVSVNTDYLIIGEGLDAVRHSKSTDKEYVAKFDKLTKELKDKASNNGVAIISLRRYLDMIGYQPPKIVTNPSQNR